MSVQVCSCGKLPGAGAKFCAECGLPVPAAGQSETPKKRRRTLDAAELGKLAMKSASKEVQQERTNDNYDNPALRKFHSRKW